MFFAIVHENRLAMVLEEACGRCRSPNRGGGGQGGERDSNRHWHSAAYRGHDALSDAGRGAVGAARVRHQIVVIA